MSIRDDDIAKRRILGEKFIRRINRLLESYVLKFGKDYSLYTDILNSLSMNDIATRINNKGIIQVQRGKVNQNLNQWQFREIEHLAKLPTAATIYKKVKEDLKKNPVPPTPPNANDPFKGMDAVIREILKRDYVKKNKDIFTYLSDQVKSMGKLSEAERALYNRAAGRSEELTYDELYNLIRAAKGE